MDWFTGIATASGLFVAVPLLPKLLKQVKKVVNTARKIGVNLRERTTRDDEVVPGHKNPTVTLVHLIATRMIREPTLLNVGYRVIKWENGPIKVCVDFNGSGSFEKALLVVDNETIELSDDEKKIFHRTVNQCKILKEQQEVIDKRAANQLKAVSAIETIMGLPSNASA